MNEIQRQLSAASFKNNDRSTKQVDLIVDLLTNSIKENRQITIEDIIETFLVWKEQVGKKLILAQWNSGYQERNEHHYKYKEVSKKEFAQHWETKQKARNWFKTNLGAAIIRGKILAIPVIDIT
jgi:hypothetical protein